ncbi:unnamed protein product [Caenorhabditis sp. 36 PRJEB53466]|nr:unnamed protein product [Caenorhabditis sp. 36 PRJEB53466]
MNKYFVHEKYTDPSNLPAAAMSFNIENESLVCQLHHKTKHNRSLNVVVELSAKIGSPLLENGEWVVPSEITGLKAKKSKVVKVRFSPLVSELSSIDAAVHRAACESAIKHLDILLEESVWTRQSSQDEHPFGKQIGKMLEILEDMDKVVEIDNNKVHLSFLKNDYFDELLKLINCKSVSANLRTIIVDDGEQQTADVVLRVSENIGIRQECVFELSKTCFNWILTRCDEDLENSPPNVSQKLDCYMWIDGKEHEMPVYSPCASVFHHLDKLSTSLTTVSPPVSNETLPKVPHALAVDAIVGLDKNEALCLHKFIQNIKQVPLTIHTDFDVESMDVYSDTETKLSGSPTESIDSGVSSLSSPRQSTFDEEDEDEESPAPLANRFRSWSESGSSLKGILKWPSTRRSTSRLLSSPHMIRSYSECHHDDSLPMMPLRFSEDDEDAFHEEDSSSDCCVLPAAPRKKSVSFSERIVQTRLFNSNTSIDAQKRKNLKKNEKKKKREGSLASSIESLHEESSSGRVSPAIRHQTV